VYGSGLRGFCHGGSKMRSGLLRECSFSKYACSMLMICEGFVVISLVVGSRIASRLGWSFALGWRPAAVLRLLWYRLGIFLYSTFYFFRWESTSLRLTLLIIVAMALLHKARISIILRESMSWNTLVACVWICLVCWGSDLDGLLIFELGSMRLAMFLSCVMRLRLRCVVSDLVIVVWC
jgi:hypothetical protein